MDAEPRKGQRGGGSVSPLYDDIDWLLWRPCVGLVDLCPPLARWSDMIDGTYDLMDVYEMHRVMDDLEHMRSQLDG